MNLKEKAYLEARIFDAIKQCNVKNSPKYVGFLDETGIAIANSAAGKSRAKFLIYGGFSEAQRCYFGVFPDWCEPSKETFPISRLKIANKSASKITHRDVLGAFMSAGIERETVGDIIINDDYIVAFVSATVSKHLTSFIDKIGSSGVEIYEDNNVDFEYVPKFSELSGSVASLRLDCIIAEIGKCSRDKASDFIENGLVTVHGIEKSKITSLVANNDVITVRHVGKFILDDVDKLTKKGRIALKYRKYI